MWRLMIQSVEYITQGKRVLVICLSVFFPPITSRTVWAATRDKLRMRKKLKCSNQTVWNCVLQSKGRDVDITWNRFVGENLRNVAPLTLCDRMSASEYFSEEVICSRHYYYYSKKGIKIWSILMRAAGFIWIEKLLVCGTAGEGSV